MRLARRAGLSADKVLAADFTAADIFPIIEGYLQSLKDTPGTESRPAEGQSANRKPRKVDLAITALWRNPGLSDAEIAHIAKCDPSYLSRSEEFQASALKARAAAASIKQPTKAEFNLRTGEHEIVDSENESNSGSRQCL